MRIDFIEIKSQWKNLAGFRIDFDERREVAVIIGKNGSAKSNLLEAIITILEICIWVSWHHSRMSYTT